MLGASFTSMRITLALLASSLLLACTTTSSAPADASADAPSADGGADALGAGDAATGPLCDKPLDETACGGPCPATIDDVCALGLGVGARWTKPCDGALGVAFGIGVDCSKLFFFDATTKALVATGSGCNGNDACTGGGAGVHIPSECLDGNHDLGIVHVCTDAGAGDASSD